MAPFSLSDLLDAVPTGAAARRLGLSDSYIRRLTRDGRLRSVKTALGHLIPREALDEFARERERMRRSAGRAR